MPFGNLFQCDTNFTETWKKWFYIILCHCWRLRKFYSLPVAFRGSIYFIISPLHHCRSHATRQPALALRWCRDSVWGSVGSDARNVKHFVNVVAVKWKNEKWNHLQTTVTIMHCCCWYDSKKQHAETVWAQSVLYSTAAAIGSHRKLCVAFKCNWNFRSVSSSRFFFVFSLYFSIYILENFLFPLHGEDRWLWGGAAPTFLLFIRLY